MNSVIRFIVGQLKFMGVPAIFPDTLLLVVRKYLWVQLPRVVIPSPLQQEMMSLSLSPLSSFSLLSSPLLLQIRNFITAMHDFLLQNYRADLMNCGMESCDNVEHVMETTLQQCILQPLSHYVYLRIEEYFTQNNFLFQVQRSIYQGKQKSPEGFGIRVGVVKSHGGC